MFNKKKKDLQTTNENLQNQNQSAKEQLSKVDLLRQTAETAEQEKQLLSQKLMQFSQENNYLKQDQMTKFNDITRLQEENNALKLKIDGNNEFGEKLKSSYEKEKNEIQGRIAKANEDLRKKQDEINRLEKELSDEKNKKPVQPVVVDNSPLLEKKQQEISRLEKELSEEKNKKPVQPFVDNSQLEKLQKEISRLEKELSEEKNKKPIVDNSQLEKLQKENQQLQSEIESFKKHPISTGVTTQRTSTPPPEKKPTEDLQLHKLQQEAHLAEIKRLADENYKYKTIMINEGRNTLLRKINSLKLKLVDTRDALEKAKNNNSLKLDIEKLKSEIQTQKKKNFKINVGKRFFARTIGRSKTK